LQPSIRQLTTVRFRVSSRRKRPTRITISIVIIVIVGYSYNYWVLTIISTITY
jgi:hypothetical protein